MGVPPISRELHRLNSWKVRGVKMSGFQEQVGEKVHELIERAEELVGEVENYLSVANRIDDEKIARVDHSLSLDDLPYGEERVRLEGAPETLKDVLYALERINVASVPVGKLDEILSEAEQSIDDVKSTIDDCTPLPSTDIDDDDD